MRIELRYTSAAIPPLHERICDSPALDREITVGGQTVDGVDSSR